MYYTNDDIDVDVDWLQTMAAGLLIALPAVVILLFWLAPLLAAL